jgi:hypothetical protein
LKHLSPLIRPELTADLTTTLQSTTITFYAHVLTQQLQVEIHAEAKVKDAETLCAAIHDHQKLNKLATSHSRNSESFT